MVKIFQLVKNNLLGVSIAIGAISFLIEVFLGHNNYRITVITLCCAFILSAYIKYNESAEQRSKFKAYLRYDYKLKIISLIFVAWLIYTDRNEPTDFVFVLFFIINLFRNYYSFDAKLAQIEILKTKGLTKEDVWNIEFVKSWEETRKAGIWRYCIRDGGIIAGAILLFLVGIVYANIFQSEFKVILSSPGTMFSFIGYCYMAGALIGVILYRVLWIYKERRFNKLTDPLNSLFETRKTSVE